MALVEQYPKAETELGQSEFSPRYDMSAEEAYELCSEFLRVQEHRPDTQFGCYMIGNSSKYSNLGRYVESNVFLKSFGNTPNVMESEYGPYEQASNFFVVIDQETEKPVGVMRVIENSDAGLKSLVDLKRTPLHLT